jgi:dihydroorotate dehydrogenase (NAD+) catalytic subunit
MSEVDLTSRVGSVVLRNPVMTASGTAGQSAELAPYLDLAGLGAVVVKSLSPEPWAGNPAPRLTPVTAGMLNSVGLQNPGIDRWLAHDLPALAATGASVVVSVWGFTVADYRRVAARIARAIADPHQPATGSIVALEANISCPNIEDRRQMFSHHEDSTEAAVTATIAGLSSGGLSSGGLSSGGLSSGGLSSGVGPERGSPVLPVWAKLSPNVTDLPAIAGAALRAGASGLTLTNTLMGLAIDPVTGRPRLGNGGGGLSGPALHPVAVRAVFECRAAWPDAPIVGVGGIVTGVDAAELLAAGADAVQVGTATFADPRAPARILGELTAWCDHHGMARITDLIGSAHDGAGRA